MQDLKTNSNVINFINSTNDYEQNIFKGGIYCREQEPVLWNMCAHTMNVSEGTVSYILDFVYAVKLAFITYHLYSYYYALDENNAPAASFHEAKLISHIGAFNFLASFNQIWKQYILQSNYSDGVVDEYSQKYPNANKLYLSENTSHLEELNHYKVRDKLVQSIRDYIVYLEANNPPAAPKNLKVISYYDEPKLTWDANTEADLKEYLVYRSIDDGVFNLRATVKKGKTSLKESDIDWYKPIYKYSYKIKAKDTQGRLSEFSNMVWIRELERKNNVENNNIKISIEDEITSYSLNQNYPNPFNPKTTIKYALPKDGFVEIKVFDAQGKEVASLVNEYKSTGRYNIIFDGSKLSSGIYFYQIKVNNFIDSKKFILMK